MATFINPFASDIEKAAERKKEGKVAKLSRPETVTLSNPDIYFLGGLRSAELDSIFIEKVGIAFDKATTDGKSFTTVFYSMCRKTRYPMSYNELAYIADKSGFKSGMLSIWVQTQGVERALFAKYAMSDPELSEYLTKYDALGEFGLGDSYDTTNFIVDFMSLHEEGLRAPFKTNTQQQPDESVKADLPNISLFN